MHSFLIMNDICPLLTLSRFHISTLSMHSFMQLVTEAGKVTKRRRMADADRDRGEKLIEFFLLRTSTFPNCIDRSGMEQSLDRFTVSSKRRHGQDLNSHAILRAIVNQYPGYLAPSYGIDRVSSFTSYHRENNRIRCVSLDICSSSAAITMLVGAGIRSIRQDEPNAPFRTIEETLSISTETISTQMTRIGDPSER
jgi:hypothetical protein